MTHFLDPVSAFAEPEIASIFDQLPYWSSRFGALLFDHLTPRPDLRILDTACGTGFPLIDLAFFFGPTCRLTGLDSWRAAVERARWKLAHYDLPNVDVLEGDAAAMPFPAAEFDLVTCNLGINNFDDADAVAREWLRVLKPGARLALTSNVTGNMREFYEVYRAVLRETGRTQHIPALDAQEGHRRSREAIGRWLEEAGFTLADAAEDSFALRYADGTAMFCHHLIRVGFLDGWRAILPLGDHRPVFEEVERRLNAIAARQGELRLTIPMVYIEARKPA